MISHIWGQWTIGERLDVLPDVLYYHKDQSFTICPSRTAWLRLWIFSTNKSLVDQASSHRLTVSPLLGGSPSFQGIIRTCIGKHGVSLLQVRVQSAPVLKAAVLELWGVKVRSWSIHWPHSTSRWDRDMSREMFSLWVYKTSCDTLRTCTETVRSDWIWKTYLVLFHLQFFYCHWWFYEEPLTWNLSIHKMFFIVEVSLEY